MHEYTAKHAASVFFFNNLAEKNVFSNVGKAMGDGEADVICAIKILSK